MICTDDLRTTLCATLVRAGIRADAIPVIADDLIARYQEPQRHYHTLEHIYFLLARLDTAPLENRAAVELLAWFHDAIYNPRGKGNEAKSAELAQQVLTPYADTETLHIVVEGTVLSQHHRRADHYDINHFLDADLGVFSQPNESYQLAAKAIRDEYAHVPGWLYKIGRKKVLKGMLRRQPFYHTEWASLWEDEARANVAWEIANL